MPRTSTLVVLFAALTVVFVVFVVSVDSAMAQAAKASSPIAIIPLDIKEPIVFDKHVFGILKEKCLVCHDEKGGLAEAQLDLTSVANIEKGGKRGPSLVKGKGNESLLVKVSSRSAKPFMPPKGDDPLTPRELSILKAWIDQGAMPGKDLNPAASMVKAVALEPLPPGVHPVYSMEMDAEGTMLAAGRANHVLVYDVASGRVMVDLAGHQDIVQSVKLSPDGRWIAAGGYQVVKLWRRPSATPTWTTPLASAKVSALASDVSVGWGVIAGEDQVIRLFDLANGRVVRESRPLGAPIHDLALDPLFGHFATASADKKVRLWRLVDGANIATFEGHADAVLCVALRDDGGWIAAGGKDGSVRLWPMTGSTSTPNLPKVLASTGKPVRKVAFLGPWIIAGGDDGVLRCWNVSDQALVRELKIGSPIRSFALSRSTAADVSSRTPKLVLGSDDGVVRWISADRLDQPVSIAVHSQPITQLALSDDQSMVLAATAEGVQLLSLDDGKPLLGWRAKSNGPMSFLSASSLLTVTDESLRAWSTSLAWSAPVDLGPLSDRVTALSFSADGKLLAAGGGPPTGTGEIVLFDLETKKAVRSIAEPHSDAVLGLAFSPDGKLLASCSADKFVRVHEVATGKRMKSFEGHTHHVLAVAWKPDGKEIASASADNTVKIWNVDTGDQIRTIAGHGKQVTGLSWLPMGNVILTSSADKIARWINPSSGAIARKFTGAGDYLHTVTSTKDGRVLAAAGQDGKIHIWDGASAKALKVLDQGK